MYCTQNATFWTPFGRIAVAPEFGSSVLFARIMGPSIANEMLLGMRKLTAADACACGLVGRVFPTKEAVLAAADCTDDATDLCSRYGVNSFPTLKWFPNDKPAAKGEEGEGEDGVAKLPHEDYDGTRDSGGLITFVSRQLEKAFDAFDTSGDGVVSKSDLREMLRRMATAPLDEAKVDTILNELADAVDAEEGGQISLGSFSRWMGRTYSSYMHNPALVKDSTAKWREEVYNQ